jgi:hypothetical protein
LDLKKQQEAKLSTTSGLKRSSRYKPAISAPISNDSPISTVPQPVTISTNNSNPPKSYLEYTPTIQQPMVYLPQPVSAPPAQEMAQPTNPPLLTEEVIKKQQMAAGWKDDYVIRRCLEEAFGGI